MTTPGLNTNDGGTRGQHFAFGVLAFLLVLAGLHTLWNFLSALAWAVIFAVALWPLYSRMGRRFGGGEGVLWPIIFTLGVALLFLTPLVLVGVQLAREAHSAAEWARGAQENGVPLPDLVHRLPVFQSQISSWWQRNLADPHAARALLERTTHGHIEDTGKMVAAQVAPPLHPVHLHPAHRVLPVPPRPRCDAAAPLRRHPRLRAGRENGSACRSSPPSTAR